jgi:hypothetical protein
MTEIAIPNTDYETLWKLSQRISNTPFVPTALRGKNEAVLACVLYGAELGLGPMQSLNSIHVIEGRTAMSPELMRAMVARHGHRIDVIENSNDVCEVKGTRADTGSTATVRWTIDDAKMAGLAGKNNWKTYPRAMLLARATSELCRIVFPDVIAGLSYTPEEVASIAGIEYEEPTVPAAPAIKKPVNLDDEIVEAEIVIDTDMPGDWEKIPSSHGTEAYEPKQKPRKKVGEAIKMTPVEEVVQEALQTKSTTPSFEERLEIASSWGRWPYVKAIAAVYVKKLGRDNMPISYHELAHDEKLWVACKEAMDSKAV